jgi:hypothetical protein
VAEVLASADSKHSQKLDTAVVSRANGKTLVTFKKTVAQASTRPLAVATAGETARFSLCDCARPTFNPLGSALVRYFDVAAISVPPA